MWNMWKKQNGAREVTGNAIGNALETRSETRSDSGRETVGKRSESQKREETQARRRVLYGRARTGSRHKHKAQGNETKHGTQWSTRARD